MKEFFTGQPRVYTRAVAVVARRGGGLLLERVNGRLDLIRGLVQPGEDDEAAAVRLLESRTGETAKPERLPASITEMQGNTPVQYQLMEVEDFGDGIPDDADAELSYISSSHMNKLFAAGVGATAILGAFLGVRIIRARRQGE